MSATKVVALLIVVTHIFLAGCASVPLATPEADQAAKSFSAPTPGKAGLYLFRDYAYLVGDDRKSIYLDGSFVGETSSMTYFYVEVEPGRRTLSVRSQSKIAGDQPDPFSTNATVDMEPGKTYFVRQYRHLHPLTLVIWHDALMPVAEDAGKRGVLRCRLANTAPGEAPYIATGPAAATAELATELRARAEAEIATASLDDSLWQESLGLANNDDQKTRAIYVELRAQQLYAEQAGQPLRAGPAGVDLTGTYASFTTNAARRLGLQSDPEVRLVQQGNRISGLYGDFNFPQQGKIYGELVDGTIKFDWYAIDGNYGRGSWTPGADGAEIDGQWSSLSSQSGSGQWNLVRLDNLANADVAALLNTAGGNQKPARGRQTADTGRQTDNTGWLFLLLFIMVKTISDISAF